MSRWTMERLEQMLRILWWWDKDKGKGKEKGQKGSVFPYTIKEYFVNLVAGQELCVREEAEPCNTHDCRKPLSFYVS